MTVGTKNLPSISNVETQRIVMRQSWKQLLFLHWRYDAAEVQRLLPSGLTVQTWDDAAWVAIVPFQMRGIRPVWSPSVPHISNFLELNVRTYVTDERGVSGVWFLSLTANRRFAVWWGRTWFRLPYVCAMMRDGSGETGGFHYHCQRADDTSHPKASYRYRPLGSPAPAAPGSLEHFLVERYLLFSRTRQGRFRTGLVRHPPYAVQPVELEEWDEAPLILDGLTAPRRQPDHAFFSPGVDVEVCGLSAAAALGERATS